MSKISNRLTRIKPSATMAITAKAKAMRAEGIDVIGFGAGEPDFDTPDFVKEATIKAIKAGETKYTAVAGLPQLRDALCDYFKRTENLDYKRDETIFSLGGKHSLYNVFQALLSEDDEVVIPAPYWVSYPDMTLLAGGEPVILNAKEESGFLFSKEELDAVITERTKAIVINTPSNPSGVVYPKETLKIVCGRGKKTWHLHYLGRDIQRCLLR